MRFRRWWLIVGWFVVLLAGTLTLGQSYESCSVTKWTSETYSQSAHITRNHPVYSVRVGDVIYQIARRTTQVEMNVGQQIKCRVKKGQMLVVNEKGKDAKYDIVGSEPAQNK